MDTICIRQGEGGGRGRVDTICMRQGEGGGMHEEEYLVGISGINTNKAG